MKESKELSTVLGEGSCTFKQTKANPQFLLLACAALLQFTFIATPNMQEQNYVLVLCDKVVFALFGKKLKKYITKLNI